MMMKLDLQPNLHSFSSLSICLAFICTNTRTRQQGNPLLPSQTLYQLLIVTLHNAPRGSFFDLILRQWPRTQYAHRACTH